MEVVYRLDFINASEKKDEGYWQRIRDSGWKHVGELGDRQYFPKRARPGEPMEIFTKNQSKIAKYNRVLGFLVIFLAVIWPFLISASYPAPSLVRMDISLLAALLVLLNGSAAIRIM